MLWEMVLSASWRTAMSGETDPVVLVATVFCLGILVAYSLLAFMASAQFMHGKPFANYGFTPQLGFAFILLAFVFALLGNKAVKKDEDLVRSADRIR